MSDVARGVGVDRRGPVVVARREIEATDIAFAREKRRAGVGWQNIGRMLGVNGTDIQRAVEHGVTRLKVRADQERADTEDAGDERPAKPPPEIKRGYQQFDLLVALREHGRLTVAQLAAVVGIGVASCRITLGRLSAADCVAHGAGWVEITPMGLGALAEVEAEPPRKSAAPGAELLANRVLVLMAQGVATTPELARRLAVDGQVASNEVKRLSKVELARGERVYGMRAYHWSLTPKGRVAAARARDVLAEAGGAAHG